MCVAVPHSKVLPSLYTDFLSCQGVRRMNSTMRRRLSLPIAAIEKLEKELPKIGKEIIIEVLEKSERRFSTISETEGTEVSPGSLLHWDPKLIRQVI